MSNPRSRPVILLAACALAIGGVAAWSWPAGAAPSCSLSTLNGTYLFAGDGWSVSGTTKTPLAFAGSEQFDGAGHIRGISTSSFGGTITPRSSFTGTYSVAANCTGTFSIGTSLHFDLYTSRSGDAFTYVQTDPGSVSATTENRATRA